MINGNSATPNNEAKSLLKWFIANQRPLPWRLNRDPYRVWIAEVMLQQTTTQAVIPFYERFMMRFPDLSSLAAASEDELYVYWSGLGYYSRARNLLKAARLMAKLGIPTTAKELRHLPGFGPYTSRAVASQAFGEAVGVVDGNVVRVLCRYYGLKIQWWKTQERNKLQDKADLLVQGLRPGDTNQAMMELGATICTPKSPTCFLCPLKKTCIALDQNLIDQLPLPKPRKKFEFWLWEPHLIQRKDQVALVKNDYAPFLKNQWFFPGRVQQLPSPPKDFDFRHCITHHQIYAKIRVKAETVLPTGHRWIKGEKLSSINPASLLKKAMTQGGLL